MSPTAVEALARGKKPPVLTDDNPAVADVTLDDIILDGRPVDATITDAVLDIELHRAMDGASQVTVTVSDPSLELLRSKVFAKAVDLWIGDLPFRLVGKELQDDDEGPQLVLTFEARAVARLRGFHGAMHASRADKTRAEFIKAMCDEAGVPFFARELHKIQPIQSVEDAMTAAQRRRERHRGFSAKAKIKVKGQDADSEQLDNIDRSLQVARSLRAPDLAIIAMGCAGTGESDFRAVHNQGGSKYAGVYQADPAAIPKDDTEQQAHYFLAGGKGFQQGGAIALAKAHPTMDPGEIATRVEAGGEAAIFYGIYVDEFRDTLDKWGGGLEGPGDAAETYAKQYMFRRGTDEKPNEDSWTCMRRLADEVGWRLFEEGGTVYLMTDDDLLKSMVRYTIASGHGVIDEPTEGVDRLQIKLDTRKSLQQVTVDCHARRWGAPIGTVCELEGYGQDGDGRWLVGDILRPSIFSNQTTILLHRREKAKLEPAHDVGTRANSDTVDPGGVTLDGGELVGGTIRARVVAAAKHAEELSKDNPGRYHYSQPGAWKHDLFARDQPDERSDCSSFIIQCYEKAGCVLPSALQGQGNTGTLASVGDPTSKPQPGDICLYGTGPDYDHVELYVGGGKTIGHGSAPIDGDTVHDPALPQPFAGYWTFDFLNEIGDSPTDSPPVRKGRTGPIK